MAAVLDFSFSWEREVQFQTLVPEGSCTGSRNGQCFGVGPAPGPHCGGQAASLFSRYLASGSGDTTVRFWDLSTETPHFTCQGQYAVGRSGGLTGGRVTHSSSLIPTPSCPFSDYLFLSRDCTLEPRQLLKNKQTRPKSQ